MTALSKSHALLGLALSAPVSLGIAAVGVTTA